MLKIFASASSRPCLVSSPLVSFGRVCLWRLTFPKAPVRRHSSWTCLSPWGVSSRGRGSIDGCVVPMKPMHKLGSLSCRELVGAHEKFAPQVRVYAVRQFSLSLVIVLAPRTGE